jgi:1-acyl-sn-glycerol-3-phosphate acyltransferase
MSPLAPLWKGLRIAEHLLTGAALALVVAAGQGLAYRVGWLDRAMLWWYRRLLRCLGVRVRAEGWIADTTLLVANHISWLDIPVLGSQGNMRFLAKADVRRWPLIGWMSAVVGTVFIARGGNRAGEVVEGISARIKAGEPVVVFPEGTTSDGREVRRFHPRLFAICQQTGLAAQPVALRYGTGSGPDPVAPFLGDDTLVAHLWRVLKSPGLDVQVSFLAPIPVADLDRRRLAAEARQAITARLDSDRAGVKCRPRVLDCGEVAPTDQVCQPGDAA